MRRPLAHALASRLAEPDLTPFLDDQATHLTYLYVETAGDVRWSRFAAGAATAGAVRGRAFGLRCEVQFRRDGDAYAVLLLTDLPRPAGGDNLDLAPFDQEEATYLLWGAREAGAEHWTEAGSARRWTYPLDGTPHRVGVRAVEYRDHDSGELQFTRYLDLVPFPEGR